MNKNNIARNDYDNLCKNILSRKFMLACIMKACIDEYKDCSTTDIINKYIDGELKVGEEFLYKDDKITFNQIHGLNTEDNSINNGFIRYDIKYKALIPNSDKKAHLIINIEAQHNKNLDYSIIKRAEFYIGRLISSQKNIEFNKSDYDKINKVYSIWIFTSQQGFEHSSIIEYKTVEYNRLGDYKENKKDYDFFDIIMIRLGNKERPAKTEQ